MRIRVRGFLYKTSFEELKVVFSQFFDDPGLVSRVRVHGEEFKLYGSEFEFDCYSSLDGKWKDGTENYLLDIVFFKDEAIVLKQMDELGSVLEKSGVIYEFEFQRESEDGDEIGDEFSKKHPEYDRFMNEHY